MTWSLQLRNGDLTLGNASYGRVTGEDKLVQDLRAYILERRGTDNAHPLFGSLLDGGVNTDGSLARGLIGRDNNAFLTLEIESELRRIISEYQARQLQRAKDDRVIYGKTTLTKGEVLLGITTLKVNAVADRLDITLGLETAKGTTVELVLNL
jgi:hypothetical protein